MPTWIWLIILVLGVLAVIALVRRSSGRSTLPGRRPGLTAEQRLQMDRNRLDTSLRSNPGQNPNNLGGR